MSRRGKVPQEDKQSKFEHLVAAGVTRAMAAWLSGVDEPSVTVAELARRMSDWEADRPARPVEAEEPEANEQ